jgi:hypothetical protein
MEINSMARSACDTMMNTQNEFSMGTILCTILETRKIQSMLNEIRPLIFNDINNTNLL